MSLFITAILKVDNQSLGKEKYLLPDGRTLIACYHPSPRNVNTNLVTSLMIDQLFKKAKKIAKF